MFTWARVRLALMLWVYYFLLLATDAAGLLLAAFTLPGLWLMLAGAAFYAYLTGGNFVGYKTLIALLVLASAAEVGEFFLGGAGAKKAGASKWGIIGGLVGAIVGGFTLTGVIPIPVLGTVIGICLGSFLGAFGIELILGKPIARSVQIGYGAAKGRFVGILGKVGVGLLMTLITFWTAMPLQSRRTVKPAMQAPRAATSLPASG